MQRHGQVRNYDRGKGPPVLGYRYQLGKGMSFLLGGSLTERKLGASLSRDGEPSSMIFILLNKRRGRILGRVVVLVLRPVYLFLFPNYESNFFHFFFFYCERVHERGGGGTEGEGEKNLKQASHSEQSPVQVSVPQLRL